MYLLKIYCGLFLLFTIRLGAQFQLLIEIENIEIPQGTLFLSLFDSQEGYENNKTPEKYFKRIPISKKKVQLIFENLPRGLYAIKAYLDTNKNNELDTNFLGVPKEQYGFSNNKMGTLGPPSFATSRFEVSQNTVHQLILK